MTTIDKPNLGPNDFYLGDGIYLNVDNGILVLYTSNGIQVENVIYLDNEPWEAFITWMTKNEYLSEIMRKKLEDAKAD